MNIVYIIGNGFDINLGMKTKYADFYEYYKSINSDKTVVKHLKEDIKKGIVNWADLELKFGDYCKQFKTFDDFQEAFEDLGDNLADYLHRTEESFDFSKIDKNRLFEFLSKPESMLELIDREAVNNFQEQWKSHQWNVNLITLNYTRALENIIGTSKINNLNLGSRGNVHNVLGTIEHIHGYVDDRMILGVNDISQISNTEFHNNQQIAEALIKSTCNKVQKHGFDRKCINLITKANLICVFGCSLGDTDKCWWELVGDQLKNKNFRIILFERCDEISKRRSYKRAQKERDFREFFLSKTNLNEKEKEDALGRIYIGLNTQMFKLVD